MTSSQIPIILPVETQVRELDAKLLLACVAAERGHETFIGFQNDIRARITALPAGVFIAKGKAVLIMPVPELADLSGIAKGARKVGYRDRVDRY